MATYPVQIGLSSSNMWVETPDIPIESIAKLELKAGDILVIKSSHWTAKDIEIVRAYVQKFGDGSKPIGVMVVSPEDELTVLHQPLVEPDPFLP